MRRRSTLTLGIAIAVLAVVFGIVETAGSRDPESQSEPIRYGDANAAASGQPYTHLAIERHAKDRTEASITVENVANAGPVQSATDGPEFRVSFLGSVNRRSGTGIEGARLQTRGSHGPIVLAASDAAGQFNESLLLDDTFWDAVEDPYRGRLGLELEVLADGFAGYSTSVRLGGSGAVDLGAIELRLGYSLTGRVENGSGVAVSNALAMWLPGRLYPHEELTSRTGGISLSGVREFVPFGLTDDRGRFVLNGVPGGAGFVIARANGTEHAWTPVFDARDGDIGEPIVLRRAAGVVVLRAIVLGSSGHVAPDTSVIVQMREGDGRIRTTELKADSEGAVETEVGEGLECRITAIGSGETALRATWVGVPYDEQAVALRLESVLACEVIVVDPEGEPVPWANVRLIEAGDWEVLDRRLHQAGRDGRTSALAPSGPFRIRVMAPGYRTTSFGPFEPEAIGGELRVAVEPGQAVRGTVTRAGHPVSGARLAIRPTLNPGVALVSRAVSADGAHALPFTIRGRGFPLGHDATTDEAGAFVATVHQDCWYSVTVVAEGHPISVFGPFELSTESTHTIDLRVPVGGAIEGRLRDSSGEPIPGARMAASSGWGFALTCRTGADGAYRFESLQPGEWQVRESPGALAGIETLIGVRPDPESRPLPWDCVVGSGATARVDLILP